MKKVFALFTPDGSIRLDYIRESRKAVLRDWAEANPQYKTWRTWQRKGWRISKIHIQIIN